MVMVPLSGSVSAMVRGIRSPPSRMRRITKFPGNPLRAICGASMISSLTRPGMSSRFFNILYTRVSRGFWFVVCRFSFLAGTSPARPKTKNHQRKTNLLQQLPQSGKGILDPRGVAAAGLSHVRTPAAAAADAGSHVLDQGRGREPVVQVFGNRENQHGLLAQIRGQADDTGIELGTQVVHQG